MSEPAPDGTIVVLNVHGIGPTGRTLDPGEDRTWVTVEQFEQTLDAVIGRSDVRLTFDDGNASDVEIALPRLKERGLTAEFFLLAGRLEEAGRVDRDAVRELCAAGMSIGSHGWAHVNWRGLDDDQALREIGGATRVLGELSGQSVDRVAIPFGSYDRVVLQRLRRAGIRTAFSSDGGRTRADKWLQARNSLPCTLSAEWLYEVLDGQPSPARRLRRLAARTVKGLRGTPKVTVST